MITRESIEEASRKTSEHYKELNKDLSNICPKWHIGKEIILRADDEYGMRYMFGKIEDIAQDVILDKYTFKVSFMADPNVSGLCYVPVKRIDANENEVSKLECVYNGCGIYEVLYDINNVDYYAISSYIDCGIGAIREDIDKLKSQLECKTAFDILKDKRDLQSLIDFIIEKEEKGDSWKEKIKYAQSLVNGKERRIEELNSFRDRLKQQMFGTTNE